MAVVEGITLSSICIEAVTYLMLNSVIESAVCKRIVFVSEIEKGLFAM